MSKDDPMAPKSDLDQLFGEARDPVGDTDLDALFAATARERDAERGPLAWLRSRPTWLRRLVALAAVLACVGTAAWSHPRPDLGEVGWDALVLPTLSLGVMLVAAVWLGLRPLYEPTLARWKTTAFLVLCALATVVATLVPAEEASPHGFRIWPCFGIGLLIALPVYAIMRVVDRGSRLSAILAAGVAGLAGNIGLEARCAMDGAAHGLGGHASVLFVLLLGVAAASWVEVRLNAKGPARLTEED